MKSKFFLVLGSAFMIISGCSAEQWYKDGATNKQRTMAITKCKARSLEKLPPDNKVQNVSGSRSYELSKKNIDDDSDENYNYLDANEEAREVYFKNCMFELGWDISEQQSNFSDILTGLKL
ncbi:hypothetical protein [Enterobacter bugandensis]|uniref:hypothetical protein n=1 Tax=Enterobacter bugandensis TaxID=881260 RepID=UPI0022E52DD4|nr:hypothetical protein [Enterobacter bugandensis]